jgi:uncharacterized membrane protein YdjX (TVP38/TMEM64 family)
VEATGLSYNAVVSSEPATTAARPDSAAAEPPSPSGAAPQEAATPRVRWWRLALLAALVIGLVILGKLTGLTAYLSTEHVRGAMTAAGWWGVLLFLAAFCLGELVHVPGMVFVAAAVIAYGRVAGGGLAFVGALLSLTVSFAIVRGVGGKPLGAIKWRFVRRLLGHLESHPVRTITLLRLVLWMAPQLNYALALANVRFRDYLLGSALGLALPLAGTVLLFDRFFN